MTLKTLQQQTFKIRMEPHETVSAARAGAAGSEPRGGRAGLGLTPPPARDGPDLFPARGGARGGGGAVRLPLEWDTPGLLRPRRAVSGPCPFLRLRVEPCAEWGGGGFAARTAHLRGLCIPSRLLLGGGYRLLCPLLRQPLRGGGGGAVRVIVQPVAPQCPPTEVAWLPGSSARRGG